jgi:hypothetical protein
MKSAVKRTTFILVVLLAIIGLIAIIYRARIISETELSEDTQKLFKELPNTTLLGNKRYKNHTELLESFISACNNAKTNGFDFNEELLLKFKQAGFWGFSAKDSGAPPCNKATSGRINPAGISYLYVAENAHTAIVEVRPIIGQMVSVAEIETKKKLKLFDFCARPVDTDGTRSGKMSIFDVMAKNFSMPNHIGEFGYYPTQYISEMLRSRFDGCLIW